MKWIKIIEKKLVEKIPQVEIAKIPQPRKAKGGYIFDLHLKLTNGDRGTCRGLYITREFIRDSALETSDIFVDVVKEELRIYKNQLDKPANKGRLGVKDGG